MPLIRIRPLATALLFLPVAASAQTATFSACYVPAVGAIYLIKRVGLPAACLSTNHVEVTWTEGLVSDASVTTAKIADGAVTAAKLAVGVGGTITGVTAGTGLSGGGSVGSVSLDVSYAGPGVAATAARSDHTHALSGINNTGVGGNVLGSNTGGSNTAVGATALRDNTTGEFNTAIGVQAMLENETGSSNVVVGHAALANSIASGHNVALGAAALVSLTGGVQNIAIGSAAGINLSNGTGNIYLGSVGGASSESHHIRIGDLGNPEQRIFIAGINGRVTSVNDAVPVLIASNGQLGTINSSRRVKDDIADLGDMRELLRLRPVRFRYTQPMADGSKPLQYGLIAEEVAAVFPQLVAFDSSGQPNTVYYHVLPVLLLNELQRQQREVGELRARLEALERGRR